MRSKRSVVAWSIPVILGLLGCANVSLAQGNKPEPPKPPKKSQPPKKVEPKGEKDLAETLKTTPDLKQFDRLFVASGVASELKTGEYTIFAPENSALAKKGNLWMDKLLRPENKSEAKKFVEGYIVKGKLTNAELRKEKAPLKTIGGETLTIASKEGKLTVNGADVVKTEIIASNGVIHRIDQVLEEKTKPEPAPKPAPHKPAPHGPAHP